MTRPVGSVRKRGSRWEIRWSQPDPVTQKPQRRSRLIDAADRRDAVRKMHALIDATPTTGITVAQLCHRWLEQTAPDKGRKTVEEQRRTIRLHIAPRIGTVKARDLTPRQLGDLYSRLGQTRSSQTVRHVHNVLSAVFKLGVREDWLSSSPVEKARPPRLVSQPVQVPMVAELVAILDQCEPQLRRFAFLAIVSGARRGELCGLRWRDIVKGDAILIHQSVTIQQGGIAVKAPKSGKPRRVIVGEAAIQVLGEQNRFHHESGFEGAPDCYVFASPKSTRGDRPMNPHTITQAWREANQRAGMHVRLHDLRHFAASVLLADGVPIHDVQVRLGHAKPSTTLNVYGHLISDAGAEHSALLAGALEPPK